MTSFPPLSTSRYHADGFDLPRTTSVLNLWGDEEKFRQLMTWSGRLALENGDKSSHVDELERLADIGNKTHDLVSSSILGRMIKDKTADPELAGAVEVDCQNADDMMSMNAFENFDRWLFEARKYHGFVPLMVEQGISSGRLGFGGTPDLVCELDGKVTVVDWKTSSGIMTTHKVQCVAYAALVKRECEWSASRKWIRLGSGADVKVEQAAVVRLDRKSKARKPFSKSNYCLVGLREFPALWSVFSSLLALKKSTDALAKQERRL